VLLDTSCVACAGTDGPICPVCAAGLRAVGELPVPGVDRAWALMAYTGPARDLVRGVKFRNRRAAVDSLARAAAGLVEEPVTVVTWVPADPAHRRERGFDQGELLARRVGRALRRPARRLLARSPGRAQTGLDRAARLLGPPLRARGRAPDRVLVVDDVVTTGASLATAARVLRLAGARRVLAVVIAATP
jgi:predicted amidophosphoribosyltransferase